MLVSRVFFAAAITPGDQSSRNRRHRTTAGNDLFQEYHADVQAGAKHLSFGNVTEIVMSDLVGEYAA